MLRVVNDTHDMAFVEWDPTFLFKAPAAFSALFNITADPYQQTNVWDAQGSGQQASWHAEVAAEFVCRGHHGRSSDCS